MHELACSFAFYEVTMEVIYLFTYISFFNLFSGAEESF